MQTNKRRRWFALAVLACVLTSCGQGEQQTAECDQTVTETELSQAPMEARALSSSPDVEAWALLFSTPYVEPGSDLVLPANKEIKIVWKATGEDQDFNFRAIGPDGTEVQLVWGPNRQGGGDWERPGIERGTGWLLPEPGCWVLELRRGDATHTLTTLAE